MSTAAVSTDEAGMDLISTLSASPHAFLQPTPAITAAALSAVKDILDPLAADIADSQKQRRDENRGKRKRGNYDGDVPVLQLRKVYTTGLGVKQVWEQVRRVLDAACAEVELSAQSLLKKQVEASDLEDGSLVSGDEGGVSVTNDEEVLSSGDSPDEGEDEDEDDTAEDGEENDDLGDHYEDEDIEEANEDELLSDASILPQEIFVQDPNGLNDGFFSIDEFNRQSQFLEQQDARGEDDNPSDEDEIDWDADPMILPSLTPQRNAAQMSNADDDDEEDGPTFGNADIGAADDSDEDMDDVDADLDDAMPGLNNTNEIRYADFFEPPPKKPSKTKRMRALPKTQPPKADVKSVQNDVDKDVQRAIDDVNRDLFASDEESIEDDSGSDAEASKDKHLSTHEKQRAKIAAEIRRLEAANVAKRDWTLSGEARAVDRPMNSLIEEDMEFERVGKPVPVITAEVSEDIEQLIKRRITAREFDEVVRRHPDAIGNAAETRRGRVELNDAKPQTGLAEIYEQDHLKSTDLGYVDKRSAATKKQHEEIERLWKDVSSQLDLLSNLHFKPKRAEMQLKIVEDKPTISMEDARPVGAGGEDSMLAPQEVYRPGENGKSTGEVTRKGGASASKEEMSREEKTRKRRREKERMKKAGVNKASVGGKLGATADGKEGKKTKSQEKQDILADLRKGNVKVIGKKGELEDLSKQKRVHDGAIQSSSALKL